MIDYWAFPNSYFPSYCYTVKSLPPPSSSSLSFYFPLLVFTFPHIYLFPLSALYSPSVTFHWAHPLSFLPFPQAHLPCPFCIDIVCLLLCQTQPLLEANTSPTPLSTTDHCHLQVVAVNCGAARQWLSPCAVAMWHLALLVLAQVTRWTAHEVIIQFLHHPSKSQFTISVQKYNEEAFVLAW